MATSVWDNISVLVTRKIRPLKIDTLSHGFEADSPRSGGPHGGSEGRKRPRAGADCWRRLPAVCVCFGFQLRTNLFEKSFLQLFSQSTKKRTYSPCLKAKNFRFRNFFATCVVETNPNQNGRSTGRSKQAGLDRLLDRTARQADGQTARQDVREKTPAPSWEPNRVQKNTTSRILLAAN